MELTDGPCFLAAEHVKGRVVSIFRMERDMATVFDEMYTTRTAHCIDEEMGWSCNYYCAWAYGGKGHVSPDISPPSRERWPPPPSIRGLSFGDEEEIMQGRLFS